MKPKGGLHKKNNRASHIYIYRCDEASHHSGVTVLFYHPSSGSEIITDMNCTLITVFTTIFENTFEIALEKAAAFCAEIMLSSKLLHANIVREQSSKFRYNHGFEKLLRSNHAKTIYIYIYIFIYKHIQRIALFRYLTLNNGY